MADLSPEYPVIRDLGQLSYARQLLRAYYCSGPVYISNPCAYRTGPSIWDIDTHPKDITSAVARDAAKPLLPGVTLRVELPPRSSDPDWASQAASKIAELENRLCLAVMDVAMDISSRKIKCPESVLDIYQYAVFACHEYFYNRGVGVNNIIGLDGGNIIITPKRDLTGRFYIFREWKLTVDSPSFSMMEAVIGMLVYPDNILGIQKSTISSSKELLKV